MNSQQKQILLLGATVVIFIVVFGLFQLQKQGEETQPQPYYTHAILHTNSGNITIQFLPEVAPQATARFIILAENNYYDGIIVHRIIEDLAIYSGQYLDTGSLKECPYEPFPLETNDTIRLEPLNCVGDPGLTHFQNTYYDESMKYCRRLWPSKTKTIGFFIARMRKHA